MRHFHSDCEAIVMGSYADQYGGDNHKQLSLFIKDKGQSSWYYEQQLKLIKRGAFDVLDDWNKKIKDEVSKKSDIDWIFDNSKDVLASPSGASIEALAKCMGVTSDDMWGERGEGFVWYQNAIAVLSLAKPYLERQDKAGWLEHCSLKSSPL
jgi:hypothetical protein